MTKQPTLLDKVDARKDNTEDPGDDKTMVNPPTESGCMCACVWISQHGWGWQNNQPTERKCVFENSTRLGMATETANPRRNSVCVRIHHGWECQNGQPTDRNWMKMRVDNSATIESGCRCVWIVNYAWGAKTANPPTKKFMHVRVGNSTSLGMTKQATVDRKWMHVCVWIIQQV